MLSGARVLDLSGEPGWLAGRILADVGAEVVKVEPPGRDRAARRGPSLRDVEDPERSLSWLVGSIRGAVTRARPRSYPRRPGPSGSSGSIAQRGFGSRRVWGPPAPRREVSVRRINSRLATLISALGLALFLTAAVPSAHAGTDNPCAAKANPCAAKANPCAAKANPCAAKANPCAGKTNPCAAKANPCAATNPCAGKR